MGLFVGDFVGYGVGNLVGFLVGYGEAGIIAIPFVGRDVR